jgi:Zn finger protein HypA/HybF involved in hydrogenase expression
MKIEFVCSECDFKVFAQENEYNLCPACKLDYHNGKSEKAKLRRKKRLKK